MWTLAQHGKKCAVHGVDLGADFVPHGDQASLYKRVGLDAESIAKFVCEVCGYEK